MISNYQKIVFLIFVLFLGAGVVQAQTLQVSPMITPAIPEADLKNISDVFQEFSKTFSAQDFNANIKLYHFPAVRLVKGNIHFYRKLKDLPSNDLRTGLSGDYKSSDWASLEVIQASASKVHVTGVFRNLRKDGTEISRSSELFILEKIKGKWGIRARSTL